MVKVTEKQPGGAGEGRVWPVGALAGKLPSIEIADIKAARREALLGGSNKSEATKGEAVLGRDCLDERAARNPDFPAMVESYHDRRLARRLKEDPEFREEFERQQQEIAAGQDRRRSDRR